MYNDDIQGTGGVTLAGLINTLKITGGQLKEQRVLFVGGVSAAIGLADLTVAGIGEQSVPPEAVRQQIRMFDTQGLVVAGRPGLTAHKLPYPCKLPPANPSIISTRQSSARGSSRPSKISSRPCSAVRRCIFTPGRPR
jgi:malate dehydrogenase (oxaloacetate-decarboxylating)(NADP+)